MPDRTCVVCRHKDDVNLFFRMVVGPEGRIVCELGSKLPGRGAHCCFRMACISRLASSGRLGAALRRGNLGIDIEELVQNVKTLLLQNLQGMLVAAKKKGVLTLGREAVFRKMQRTNPRKPFVSSDISTKSLADLKRVAEEFYILPFQMNELGELLNRRPIGVLLVEDSLIEKRICLRLMQEKAIAHDSGA